MKKNGMFLLIVYLFFLTSSVIAMQIDQEIETPKDFCSSQLDLFSNLVLKENDDIVSCEIEINEEGDIVYLQTRETNEEINVIVDTLMGWFKDKIDKDITEGIDQLKTNNILQINGTNKDSEQLLSVLIKLNEETSFFTYVISQSIEETSIQMYHDFLDLNFNQSFFDFGPIGNLFDGYQVVSQEIKLNLVDNFEIDSSLKFYVGSDYSLYKEYVLSGEFEEALGKQLKNDPKITFGDWNWAIFELKNNVILKFAFLDNQEIIYLGQVYGENKFLSLVDLLKLNTEAITFSTPSEFLHSSLNPFDNFDVPEDFIYKRTEFELGDFDMVTIKQCYSSVKYVEEVVDDIFSLWNISPKITKDEIITQFHDDGGVGIHSVDLGLDFESSIWLRDEGDRIDVIFSVENYLNYSSYQEMFSKSFNESIYDTNEILRIFDDFEETYSLIRFFEEKNDFEVFGEITYFLGNDYEYYKNYLLEGDFEANIKSQIKESPRIDIHDDFSLIDIKLKNGLNIGFYFIEEEKQICFYQSINQDQYLSELESFSVTEGALFNFDEPMDILKNEYNPFEQGLLEDNFDLQFYSIFINEYDAVGVSEIFISFEPIDLVMDTLVFYFELDDDVDLEALILEFEEFGYFSFEFLKDDAFFEIEISQRDDYIEIGIETDNSINVSSYLNAINECFNESFLNFGELENLFEISDPLESTIRIKFNINSISFMSGKTYLADDMYETYKDYFFSEEFLDNYHDVFRSAPEVVVGDWSIVNLYFKGEIDLSILLIDESQEIIFYQSIADSQKLSEIDLRKMSESVIEFDSPMDFFSSEIYPLNGYSDIDEFSTQGIKLFIDEYDNGEFIQFLHVSNLDEKELLKLVFAAFGSNDVELLSEKEDELNNSNECDFQLILLPNNNIVHISIYKIDDGFEISYKIDQLSGYGSFFEKNFNPDLIIFDSIDSLLDRDYFERIIGYYVEDDSYWFETFISYSMDYDYDKYFNYFMSPEFEDIVIEMGGNHYNIFDQGDQIGIEYQKFGVTIRIKFDEESRMIFLSESVFAPNRSIRDYIIETTSLNDFGFDCHNLSDNVFECGRYIGREGLYMMMRKEEWNCESNQVQISGGKNELVMESLNFFNVIYYFDSKEYHVEIGNENDQEFIYAGFLLHKDGSIDVLESEMKMEDLIFGMEELFGQNLSNSAGLIEEYLETMIFDDFEMSLDELFLLPIE